MKYMRLIIFPFLLLALLIGPGCDSEDRFMLGEYDEAKAEEIRQLIASELRVGSTADDIESFFKKHNITYSYDEFSARYQAVMRNVTKTEKMDHAIVIYIYVDKNMSFKSSELNDSFR